MRKMKGGRLASRKASRRTMKRRGSRKASRRASRRRQRGGNPMMASLNQGKDYAQIHAAQHGGAAISLAASAPVGYTGVLDESLRGAARVLPLDQSVAAIQGMSDQSGGGRLDRMFRKSRNMTMKAMRNAMRRAGYVVRHPFAATTGVAKRVTKGMGKLYKRALQTRRRQAGGYEALSIHVDIPDAVAHPIATTKTLVKGAVKGMGKLYKKGRNVARSIVSRRKSRRSSRRQYGGAALAPADYGAPGMLLSPAMEAKALAGMNPEWKLATDPAAFAPKMA